MCRRCHQNHFFARCVWHINVLLIDVTDNVPPNFKVCCLGSKQTCNRNASSSNPAGSVDGQHNPWIDISPQLCVLSFIAGEKSFCTVDTTVTSRRRQHLTLWWHVESENEEIRCIHHMLSFRMTQLWRAVVVLSVGVASASPRDFVPFFGQREQRSLVNTFPFNDVDSQLPERETRQGLDNSVSSIPFSAVASSYAGGKR